MSFTQSEVNEILKSAVELAKAGKKGEGSRGGKVIGHLRNGKPVYDHADHKAHDNFTAAEHKEAQAKHILAQMKHSDDEGVITNMDKWQHHMKQIKAHGDKYENSDTKKSLTKTLREEEEKFLTDKGDDKTPGKKIKKETVKADGKNLELDKCEAKKSLAAGPAVAVNAPGTSKTQGAVMQKESIIGVTDKKKKKKKASESIVEIAKKSGKSDEEIIEAVVESVNRHNALNKAADSLIELYPDFTHDQAFRLVSMRFQKGFMSHIAGMMRPNHAYIKRTGAQGNYRYFYPADVKFSQGGDKINQTEHGTLMSHHANQADVERLRTDADPEIEKFHRLAAVYHGEMSMDKKSDKAIPLMKQAKKIGLTGGEMSLLDAGVGEIALDPIKKEVVHADWVDDPELATSAYDSRQGVGVYAP